MTRGHRWSAAREPARTPRFCWRCLLFTDDPRAAGPCRGLSLDALGLGYIEPDDLDQGGW